jgi:F-type H+-transporting ATPase subunit delta
MQAGSEKALATVIEATTFALDAGADGTELGDDLFAMALTLDVRHGMRRALTEPAVPADAKSTLVHTLVKGRISDPAFEVVNTAVRSRWSKGRDLADSLERASVTAHVAKADQDGHLDDLEDNLFRFDRIVESEPELREVLSEQEGSLEGKRKLLHTLLDGKVGAPTERVLGQAVAGRRRALGTTLAMYQKIAAARRDRLVATVWTASPLSDDHRGRLTAALARQYSHEIHLNVIVDPEVLGGVRVAIGDEIIDSTIETRLAQAHRRLVR